MDSIEPGQDPYIVPGTDVLAFVGPFADVEDDFALLGVGESPPRRIDGRFCPFCAGTIPEEFVFCTHCGRDV